MICGLDYRAMLRISHNGDGAKVSEVGRQFRCLAPRDELLRIWNRPSLVADIEFVSPQLAILSNPAVHPPLGDLYGAICILMSPLAGRDANILYM